MTTISFLGSGNAFCPSGRLHSLVLIDGTLLVDAPPTILPQLRNQGIDPSQITDLFVTHWHGDHTFGIPFLLLERKWISDRNGEHKLMIHSHDGGEERIAKICELAYPESLKNLQWVSYNTENGSTKGWNFERFDVCHDPATEPHGYLFEKDGFTVVHCGDSGPCENIERLAPDADVVIIELGIPDYVESPYHYTPSRLRDLATRCPETKFLATHNFSPSGEFSDLPENVIEVEDGDVFKY
ncbi:MAG: MBL fold metallo-hydrolase [Candidatus Thermoplasmatota archaeon]|nr:MBL fold metallo-hydrolase [Candidatus Thermoplasmatota archaeon]